MEQKNIAVVRGETQPAELRRRPYKAPRLVTHGSAADLTAANGLSGPEGLSRLPSP